MHFTYYIWSGRAAGYPCYEDDILYEYCWLHYGIFDWKSIGEFCASYEYKTHGSRHLFCPLAQHLSEWDFFSMAYSMWEPRMRQFLSTFEPVTSMIVGIFSLAWECKSFRRWQAVYWFLYLWRQLRSLSHDRFLNSDREKRTKSIRISMLFVLFCLAAFAIKGKIWIYWQ